MAEHNPLPETPIPSALRIEPRQARARETVARILDTAAVLLDEVGVDDFNTNLLAERAGVRVRTVYRYFPNKNAVLVSLAERVLAEFDAWALSELARLEPGPDWRAGFEQSTRSLLEGLQAVPGYAAIRRAMRAIPELYALEQQDNERIAEAYAHALRRVAPDVPPARARRVARCLVESACAILDATLETSRVNARAMIDELIAMQLAYLETVLA